MLRVTVTFGILALIIAIPGFSPSRAAAAPALQLPWPVGTQHRINGGYTYGCGTHDDPDDWYANQMLADATGDAANKADAIVYFGQASGVWYVAPSRIAEEAEEFLSRILGQGD